jgi:manganese/zinc/iron transport system permease protein
MVLLSASFGALAGVSGATISGSTEHLPTGPTIVVAVSVIVLVSLLLAPNRGLIWNALAQGRTRRRLRGEAILSDLAVLADQHPTLDHGHSTAVLRAMNPGRAGIDTALSDLAARGLVRRLNGDSWTLTPEGRTTIEKGEATGDGR